jgi:hypothetical protein
MRTSRVRVRALVQNGGAVRLRSDFDKREHAMSKLRDIDWLFNGRHFDREVIVLCVRWYLRYKLSLRDLVEMMAERGLSLAHAPKEAPLGDTIIISRRSSSSAGIRLRDPLVVHGESTRVCHEHKRKLVVLY